MHTALLCLAASRPIGVIAICGLHFLPLWLWLRRRIIVIQSLQLGPTASPAPSPVHAVLLLLSSPLLGALLAAGRLACLAVEGWVVGRYLGELATEDEEEAGRRR